MGAAFFFFLVCFLLYDRIHDRVMIGAVLVPLFTMYALSGETRFFKHTLRSWICLPCVTPDALETAHGKPELGNKTKHFGHDPSSLKLLAKPIRDLRLMPVDVNERDRSNHLIGDSDRKIHAACVMKLVPFFCEPEEPILRMFFRIRMGNVRDTFGDTR